MSLKWLLVFAAPLLLAIAGCGDGASTTRILTPRVAYVGPDLDVWTISVDGSGQRKLFDTGAQPGQGVQDLQWSPDGSKLAVTAATKSCPATCTYIVSPGGRNLLEIPSGSFLAWSPQSDRFALVRRTGTGNVPGDATAVVLDMNGSTLLELAQYAWQAAFSADGQLLAFVQIVCPGGICAERGALADLRTGEIGPIDPDEKPDFLIAPPIFSPTDPSLLAHRDRLIDLASGQVRSLPGEAIGWSPDGKVLALCGQADRERYLWRVLFYDIERGGTALELDFGIPRNADAVCWEVMQHQIAWPPDGHLLAYFDFYGDTGPGSSAALHIRDIVTGEDKTVSKPVTGYQVGLAFSPDSRYLLSSDYSNVWLVDVESLAPTRLAEGRQATWQSQP